MLIIKKKNMVISILVVLLVLTGYLNFIYSNKNRLPSDHEKAPASSDNELESKTEDTELDKNDDNSISDSNEEYEIPEYDTALTSSNFFIDYRFERTNTRKEEIEYIKAIIDNPNSDEEIKREAQTQLLEIAKNMENEMTIENLIKSKGFKDAIVILHRGSVNVIIDRPELKSEDVAQILSIVKRESGEKAENVTIIPKL